MSSTYVSIFCSHPEETLIDWAKALSDGMKCRGDERVHVWCDLCRIRESLVDGWSPTRKTSVYLDVIRSHLELSKFLICAPKTIQKYCKNEVQVMFHLSFIWLLVFIEFMEWYTVAFHFTLPNNRIPLITMFFVRWDSEFLFFSEYQLEVNIPLHWLAVISRQSRNDTNYSAPAVFYLIFT